MLTEHLQADAVFMISSVLFLGYDQLTRAKSVHMKIKTS